MKREYYVAYLVKKSSHFEGKKLNFLVTFPFGFDLVAIFICMFLMFRWILKNYCHLTWCPFGMHKIDTISKFIYL